MGIRTVFGFAAITRMTMRRAVRTVLILVSAVLAIAFLLHLVSCAKREASKELCCSNIFQIGYLLRVYQEQHGVLPLVSGCDNQDPVPHSWRVSILPRPLCDMSSSYDYREPWDSPKNKGQRPPRDCDRLYHCPDVPESHINKYTDYVAITGRNAIWSRLSDKSTCHIDAAMKSKILLIELPRSDVFWHEPRDMTVDEAIGKFREFKECRRHGQLHFLTAGMEIKQMSSIRDEAEFAKMLKAEE
jgi:hypothetical protein